MKNLTYDQLIELAPKDRPFQIEVESNPYGKGGKQVLWAFIDTGELDTHGMLQNQINDVNYEGFEYEWKHQYKGTFTLIDPRYQKPEVLKVGQKIRILENVKDIGTYEDWDKKYKDLVGTIDIIEIVNDDCDGVNYCLEKMRDVPHYCVQPVDDEEKEEEIPELKSTIEKLEELMNTAQELVDKYKK